ncbi:ABC transporter permease [Streptacidiphilus carbonis]|jgi:ABC-2 type transport system permease protein|uniref:ABC transporter permease n=1 Tax=Streptacidiphilus carbonis TaxID=105422 RepID=UPI0005A881A3|nr:ABC transporter permease [Streptacidiphilus carbonis]
MSTAYAMRDSMTMLRRNLKHAQRYPSMTVSIVATPILMLLLFVYVFGGTLGAGIPHSGSGGDRAQYTNFVVPGIILMAVTAGAISTAVSVCTDMTEGIINRFRTMAISRSSVLTGHVVGNVIQTMISLVLVIGVALLVGFRPHGSALDWVAALAMLSLLAFALSWVSAAIGLGAGSIEAASNAPMPLTFLPFLGSAVVPPSSMPVGLRQFAEYQPFTSITNTLRGLLMGTHIGNNAVIALAWGVGLSIFGYLWARSVFNRDARR